MSGKQILIAVESHLCWFKPRAEAVRYTYHPTARGCLLLMVEAITVLSAFSICLPQCLQSRFGILTRVSIATANLYGRATANNSLLFACLPRGRQLLSHRGALESSGLSASPTFKPGRVGKSGSPTKEPAARFAA